jgi:hypothetical protein
MERARWRYFRPGLPMHLTGDAGWSRARARASARPTSVMIQASRNSFLVSSSRQTISELDRSHHQRSGRRWSFEACSPPDRKASRRMNDMLFRPVVVPDIVLCVAVYLLRSVRRRVVCPLLYHIEGRLRTRTMEAVVRRTWHREFSPAPLEACPTTAWTRSCYACIRRYE